MKRTPVMRRKGAPAVVIAFGSPKMDKMAAEKREPEADEEMSENEDTLTCPKCGMQLADTPENRDYAKMRSDEMGEASDDAEEYEESEDEAEDEA